MSDRYARLQPLDTDHTTVQDRTVAVVGLGATGSHMAEQFARLGADLILVDRDHLELSNLATSSLYTTDHVDRRLPKAAAAASVIFTINPDIAVSSHVADVNADTVDRILADADLIMDGTDNLETRFLLNEYSVRNDVPWVHVSALGYTGEVLPVLPGTTACFNCVFADADGSELATCETAGILNATAATAANIATASAIDILSGDPLSGLTRCNLAKNDSRTLDVERREDCTVCGHHDFPYLNGEQGSTTTAVCGENTYQVNPQAEDVDLKEQADRLAARGDVTVNDHLLRFEADDAAFTLFRNGRAIIDADSREDARTVYAQFIGH